MDPSLSTRIVCRTLLTGAREVGYFKYKQCFVIQYLRTDGIHHSILFNVKLMGIGMRPETRVGPHSSSVNLAGQFIIIEGSEPLPSHEMKVWSHRRPGNPPTLGCPPQSVRNNPIKGCSPSSCNDRPLHVHYHIDKAPTMTPLRGPLGSLVV